MILWHLGLAVAVVYVTLGRRRIDYRFILLGAMLPDLIDLGAKKAAHSLVAVIVVAVAIIVGTRGERRLSLFGISVGWLLHLVGDAMWEHPTIFLWPLFGPFEAVPEPYSLALFTDAGSHLGLWAMEVIGAAILGWFWVAFRLGEDGRAQLFLRDGYLRP